MVVLKYKRLCWTNHFIFEGVVKRRDVLYDMTYYMIYVIIYNA